MNREDISAVLAEISRLLTQAEHSQMPPERATAMGRLRGIRAVLEANLRDAEASIRAGVNRRVEGAALRPALAALASELAIREATEAARIPPPKST